MALERRPFTTFANVTKTRGNFQKPETAKTEAIKGTVLNRKRDNTKTFCSRAKTEIDFAVMNDICDSSKTLAS